MGLSRRFLKRFVQPHSAIGALTATGIAVLAFTGCGSSGSAVAGPKATYQLHMEFFSHESGLSKVIDPQMFVATPGTPAGIGPQMVPHGAGVSPVPHDDPPATLLLSANGDPLHITLGQWEKAAGTVALSCTNNVESADSTLTGLIPKALYSVFVVHLNVNGAGRFTPLGNSAGTNDTFSSSGSGTASTTQHVDGCLDHQEAIVVIWHSDHMAHGSTPGTLGVTWHNSVITQVP